jgi:hypothetical protein
MTTEEIYTEIVAEKEGGSYPELNSLNNTSSTSIWRTWIFVFAYFSKTIRDLFEDFKTYIESVFAKNQAGTLNWWISELKKFQFGDTLAFLDGVFKYALIDAEKQIIKQVALEPINRQLNIKVATIVNGILAPLASAQLQALTAYVNAIKFPGTFTNVISQEADTLRLSYRIYYNAQKVKADLETTIRATVDNYLSDFVFNGRFSITGLTDKIQEIPGVINPVYVSGQAKNFYVAESGYDAIEDYYVAAAGYMKIDTLDLEFIADV